MFHIDGHSGRRRPAVLATSGERGQAEILFDKGVEFQVVRKEWNPDGYWDIFLKE